MFLFVSQGTPESPPRAAHALGSLMGHHGYKVQTKAFVKISTETPGAALANSILFARTAPANNIFHYLVNTIQNYVTRPPG